MQTWTLNCIGLASACLSICEDGAVVALHTAVGYWARDVVEYRHLINGRITNEIKFKHFDLISTTTEVYLDLSAGILNLNAISILLVVNLTFIKWPDPNDDFYII